ncbi:hypothetical protein N8223_02800 [Bacteroidia bacterium]|nr:hypothetical protein [Bacteroidia bacterium]
MKRIITFLLTVSVTLLSWAQRTNQIFRLGLRLNLANMKYDL